LILFLWHDAELLKLTIDRKKPGEQDIVVLTIKWPDGQLQDVIFEDCYLLDAKMNFGVIAQESILSAECLSDIGRLSEIKEKWRGVGVLLENLRCYRITTNSTNSQIDVYASSFRVT